MSILKQAIDKVHQDYGVYNQLEVIPCGGNDFMLAPLENSLYGHSDIEFIEAKIKEQTAKLMDKLKECDGHHETLSELFECDSCSMVI